MNQYYDIAKYQNNLLFAKSKNTFIKLTPGLVISLYYNRVPKSHKQLMQIEIREGKSLYIVKYSHTAKTNIKETEMKNKTNPYKIQFNVRMVNEIRTTLSYREIIKECKCKTTTIIITVTTTTTIASWKPSPSHTSIYCHKGRGFATYPPNMQKWKG